MRKDIKRVRSGRDAEEECRKREMEAKRERAGDREIAKEIQEREETGERVGKRGKRKKNDNSLKMPMVPEKIEHRSIAPEKSRMFY